MTLYKFDYKQYKKNLNKKNNFFFTICIIIIISLISLLTFLKPKDSKNYLFYFVEINSFETYSQALSLSTEIKEKGGAGYIFLQNRYRVLACFYSTKKEAQNVVSNLKTEYKTACVFALNSSTKKTLTFLQNKQHCTEKIIQTVNHFTATLSKLSISIDKLELTSTKIKTTLHNISVDFNNLYSDFLKNYKTDSKYNVAKKHLANIKSTLENLNNIATENNFNYMFKYYIIDIVINFSSFINCYN